MESVVVKPNVVPPVVVATLESSSSCCLFVLLAVPTVSNLVWGEHSILIRTRKNYWWCSFIVVNVDFRLSGQQICTHLKNAANVSSAAFVKYPVSAFAGMPNIPGVSSGNDFSICMLYR